MNNPGDIDNGQPIESLALMNRTARRMGLALDSVVAPAGVTFVEWRALNVIHEAGAPVPLKQLPDQLVCAKSNVTRVVDRLEHVEILRRHSHPTDRRVVLVDLTDRGIEAHRVGYQALAAFAERLFCRYSPSDRSTLERLLHLLAID